MKHYSVGPSSLTFAGRAFPYITEDYVKIDDMIIIEKKWGTETILPNTIDYTAKIMTLEPNAKVSMHMHNSKKESFILISGEMLIDVINLSNGTQETVELHEIGDSVTLEPNVPHSFYCPHTQIGLTVFVECSTKDSPRDNYRFYPSQGPKDGNSRGFNN